MVERYLSTNALLRSAAPQSASRYRPSGQDLDRCGLTNASALAVLRDEECPPGRFTLDRLKEKLMSCVLLISCGRLCRA